jgi:SM-20-related protein
MKIMDKTGDASIKIVNDFADVKHLSSLLKDKATWSFGLYAGLQGDIYPSWHMHLCGSRDPKEKTLHDDVVNATPGLESVNNLWRLVKADLAPNYGLIRAYASAHTYGQEGTMHHYAKPSDEELVALIYANSEWKDAWAGETIFYDSARECISIRPRPGRLLLFDASVAHSSRAPSRDCPTLCVTISFHMRRANR